MIILTIFHQKYLNRLLYKTKPDNYSFNVVWYNISVHLLPGKTSAGSINSN